MTNTTLFLVAIWDVSEISGRELRRRLNYGRRWWQRWSPAAFYEQMSRLEDRGLVANTTKPKVVFDQMVNEYRCLITEKGMRFVEDEFVGKPEPTPP